MNTTVFRVGFVVCVLVAALFRVIDLEQRVLHNDEANQACRAGLLLEGAGYHYDPVDHHGPTLYYLSLPFAWLSAGTDFSRTSAVTYRLLPALFGIGVLLLLLLFRDRLGRPAVLATAALLAVSPAMVYYSRFYIQEMLLVFFTAAVIVCGCRYSRFPGVRQAMSVGLFLGLMHATKETCIIAYACLGAAILPALIDMMRKGAEARRQLLQHGLVMVAVAVAVSAMIFSSFFTHPMGIIHSYTAYLNYLPQGIGVDTDHVQPFMFYLKILIGQTKGGLFWSEWPIMLLGLTGIGFSVTGASRWLPDLHRGLARFLVSYTVLMTLAYSLIAYKTPWCMLSFLFGWILLAGIGAAGLFASCKPRALQAVLVVLVLAGVSLLGRSAQRASFRYGADTRNPYAYSHTVSDLLNLVKRVNAVTALGDGYAAKIAIVTNAQDAWPLPWYLRTYPNTGYWSTQDAIPEAFAPDIIVCSLEHGPAVTESVGDDFISEYWGLRNEVVLALYLRRDLWDRFMESRIKSHPTN